jgi:hypothetical protein
MEAQSRRRHLAHTAGLLIASLSICVSCTTSFSQGNPRSVVGTTNSSIMGPDGDRAGLLPKYTQLVVSGSSLHLPNEQPWSTTADVPEGQVGTIGSILLCTSGRLGSVRILSVAALRARHPLHVVAFSTRTLDASEQDLGFNLAPLNASGFPASGAEVTPCHGSYQQALMGVQRVASTELGVEFEMTGNYEQEDEGLTLTYQGADEQRRTVEVPIDVTYCASSTICT